MMSEPCDGYQILTDVDDGRRVAAYPEHYGHATVGQRNTPNRSHCMTASVNTAQTFQQFYKEMFYFSPKGWPICSIIWDITPSAIKP